MSIADRALDVVEDALEDKDPQVRLRASQQLLDRVLPRRERAVSVTVGIVDASGPLSPAAVIRARKDAPHPPGRPSSGQSPDRARAG